MRHIIFYSWQSDLPNNTNRSFIHDALNQAAYAIASELDIEPSSDTPFVPSPLIAFCSRNMMRFVAPYIRRLAFFVCNARR